MRKNNGRRRHRGQNRRNFNNLNKNTVIESFGPISQIRGNVQQLNEKYNNLGNDAASNDDKVLSESSFWNSFLRFNSISFETYFLSTIIFDAAIGSKSIPAYGASWFNSRDVTLPSKSWADTLVGATTIIADTTTAINLLNGKTASLTAYLLFFLYFKLYLESFSPAIILDAIKDGKLKDGGTIVEGTAGNTGIGLGLVGNSMGFKTIIVMPETQSQEKKDALNLIGCELKLVPALPYSNPGNYIRQSETLANELNKSEQNGVLWANQFDNISNMNGHFDTTGPEIWAQLDGKVDGFTCAVGTGGTLAGVSKYLKEKKEDVKIFLSDPYGSALYNYYKKDELKAEGNSITEGIGQGRITENLKNLVVDDAVRINDKEALEMIFKLLKEEGLFLGGSSGINVCGAIKMAEKLGPGHNVVTILCDSGQRYQSKIWNKGFLKSKDLPFPSWME